MSATFCNFVPKRLMDKEWWKMVPGYEGLYEVSNWGRVKGLKYGRILKPCKDQDGYLSVQLCKEGKIKRLRVHRLVAMAFIPNPDNLPCVNHINEIKTDNRVENLEWVTNKENSNHGTRNKRISSSMTNGKLSKPVLQYTTDGEFVREWPSTAECGRHGFDFTAVSACCRGKYGFKTHKGYIWKYK